MLRSIVHLGRRLARQPLVTSSVILGVALAVGLAVAAGLSTNALAVLGLRASISALPRTSQNIQLTRVGEPFNQPFERRMRRLLGDLIATTHTVSYLPTGLSHREGPLIVNPARLRTQSDLEAHVRLTSGRGTQPRGGSASFGQPLDCQSAPFEAIVSDSQLVESDLRVGDLVCVDNIIPITIVGSFVPNSPDDDYWLGDYRPINGERAAEGLEAGGLVVVFMLAQPDLRAIEPIAQERRTTHIYRVLVDPRVITLDRLAAIDSRLRTFRTQINTIQPRVAVLTGIDRAISTFYERFRMLQSALGTLLLGMVMLAVVYLVLIGSLAVEQQSSEIAIIRSRGGSRLQVIGHQVGQAVGMTLPGIAVGFGLAWLAMLFLGETATFRLLRGGDQLAWRVTGSTLLLAAAIAVVACLGLIFAARPALAMSLASLRRDQARPPQRFGWRRVQAELLVLVFAALSSWQLHRYGGSLTTTGDEGAARFNVLVLAAPVLILAGAALLFLRLFPVAVQGLGHLAGRRRGLVGTLSAWQLARNPWLYGRLVLLLILTVGLGVYSQAVTNTLGNEQNRRALQEAGADVRVSLQQGDDPAPVLAAFPRATSSRLSVLPVELVKTAPGSVPGTQIVERLEGTALLSAVEGAELATVLARSGSDDRRLLASLRLMSAGALPPLGLPLPPATQALELQYKGTGQGFTVYAKLAGLNGTRLVPIGAPREDWQVAAAVVPEDLQEPVALQGFVARPDASPGDVAAQDLVFADLAARTATERVGLPAFDSLDRWEAAGVQSGDVAASRSPGVTPDQAALRLTFSTLRAGRWAALRYRISSQLPVYIARELRGQRLDKGRQLTLRIGERLVSAVVQDRTGRFPGVDDIRQPSLLADYRRLDALLTYGLPTTLPYTEVRLALPAGSNATAVPGAVTRAAALLVQASDPLGNGVRVTLLLGFACALVLSIVGFVSYAGLSIRARQIELAVLSALGLSSREVLLLVASEQGFVLAGGTLAGVLVGLVLALSTRPFLAIVSQSTVSTPALVNWTSIGLLVAGLVFALVIALALLLLIMGGRGVVRSLKLGEAQ